MRKIIFYGCISLDGYLADKTNKNIIIPTESPVDLANSLVKEDGKDIWVVGGGEIITELIEADLVDELIIQIAPILLGDGNTLFKKLNSLRRFKLTETVTYGDVVEIKYTK
ncbi:dihydrofolate reductase family protein [Companilactobacillus metriopterae]|uniref:dihydrofolate reductase family protein n=1 Tax=Companilactobacillus metriopterae TaxID=1909267 RepID=UPI00100A69A0|nr:dihydrofolate reductase family protein [Companilactobacillus metriopterae]